MAGVMEVSILAVNTARVRSKRNIILGMQSSADNAHIVVIFSFFKRNITLFLKLTYFSHGWKWIGFGRLTFWSLVIHTFFLLKMWFFHRRPLEHQGKNPFPSSPERFSRPQNGLTRSVGEGHRRPLVHKVHSAKSLGHCWKRAFGWSGMGR